MKSVYCAVRTGSLNKGFILGKVLSNVKVEGNGTVSCFYLLWDFNSHSDGPSDSTIIVVEKPMIVRLPKASCG